MTIYFPLNRIQLKLLQFSVFTGIIPDMANLKNAKKAIRKAQANYEHNRRVKDRIHRWELKTQAEIKAQKKDDATKSLSFLTKLLDKAARRNIISTNRAQRVKSRMQKFLNAV
jgi:ribosomal protein S20